MSANARKPHPADDLSFMKRKKPRGTGIDYWCVESTGNYGEDCLKGRVLADEFLDYVGRHPTYGNSALLGWIVESMLANLGPDQRLRGVEISFLAGVMEFALATSVLVTRRAA